MPQLCWLRSDIKMKISNIIALSASITLIGCASVLKNPTFSVNTDEPSAETVKYSVTEFDASPQVVTRANQSDFVRFVNLGDRNEQQVQRVTEQSLFAGARPPSGVRPIYKIGIGDELRVIQTHYRVQPDGLEVVKPQQMFIQLMGPASSISSKDHH